MANMKSGASPTVIQMPELVPPVALMLSVDDVSTDPTLVAGVPTGTFGKYMAVTFNTGALTGKWQAMTDELAEACEYLFGEEVVSEGDHDDSLMALESFIIGAATTFEKKLTNLRKQNTHFKKACEDARGEAAQAQAILDEQLKQRASKKRKIGVVTINDDDDTDVEDDVPTRSSLWRL